jgi:hypothetical protein
MFLVNMPITLAWIDYESQKTRHHFGTAQIIPGNPYQKTGTGELGQFQDFMTFNVFGHILLPVLVEMTTQFAAVMADHAGMVGSFFDAEEQADQQRALQILEARASKDYRPSIAMCEMGTVARGLDTADENAILTSAVLDERERMRETASVNTEAAGGPEWDRAARFDQFRNRYCDRFDNDAVDTSGTSSQTGLGFVCTVQSSATTINKDIDAFRTLWSPSTLNIDFTDTTQVTDDEQDIMALGANLYSHDVFKSVPPGIVDTENNQGAYMDLRAVIAKRSVAENSFNTIVGLKSEGSVELTYPVAGLTSYVQVILSELGLTAAEAQAVLGDKGTDCGGSASGGNGGNGKGNSNGKGNGNGNGNNDNCNGNGGNATKTTPFDRPSYLAQLEVLAKRLYERPAFYTQLYEEPENTQRRGVAMQAIDLMVNREIYNSHLRSEAILATLLEMKLLPQQEAAQNTIRNTNVQKAP